MQQQAFRFLRRNTVKHRLCVKHAVSAHNDCHCELRAMLGNRHNTQALVRTNDTATVGVFRRLRNLNLPRKPLHTFRVGRDKLMHVFYRHSQHVS